MKRGGLKPVLIAAALVAACSGLGAADHYSVVNGPKNFYFGHISFIEATDEGSDPVVMRAGAAAPEPAVLNLPIGPGDTIKTSADRRCEIQFDTGTIVRLDFSTELRVETILARSLSSLQQISNLALDRGRVYVMYRAYDGREIFQLLTPNAAVKMSRNAVAIISASGDGSTETQMHYGKARVLFGPSDRLLDDREVKKGQRLILQADNQFQIAPSIEGTPFELWNKEVNAHFEDLHEGLSVLPKPVQKLPPAVFYFAQTYGSLYGEWLWDEYYGYVWRPFVNNGMYPWGWRPYYYGQWSYSGGQMFWVPQEPWGWVPYHLGIWQWDKKHGWVWLPGSMFAPAWATWDFYFGYACWRPWSLYDWMGGPYYSGFSYLDGSWFYGLPYADGGGGGVPPRATRTVVLKDQLKQPGASGLPVPPELKSAVKKVTLAFEKGEARIQESAGAAPNHLVFVTRENLKAQAVNEKAVAWKDVPKPVPPEGRTSATLRRAADPQSEAARIFRGAAGQAQPVTPAPPADRQGRAPEVVRGRTFVAVPLASESPQEADRHAGAAPAPQAAAPAARFRDWNPDVRIARQLGAHIEYSSQTNEVRCPELKISSQDREGASAAAPRMTSGGVSYGPSGSFGPSGSGSSSGSSSGSTSSSGSRDTSGRSSTSSSSSSGRAEKSSTSETIKK